MSGVFPEPYSTPLDYDEPDEADDVHVDENDHELLSEEQEIAT